MDSDMLKTGAAYGGLILGVINLGLLLYKEYLRRGRLVTAVQQAEVRALTAGTFDIQVDFDLSAKGGAIYIKEISLEHQSIPVFDPGCDVKTRRLRKIINAPGYSTLDAANEKFIEEATALLSASEAVVNLKLDEKEHRIFSILDRIPVERGMDGYWDWPRTGWAIRILHSEGETLVPLSFLVHKSNLVSAFA